MKNNRAVIYVIGALCLITLVLGIVGLTNKGSSNNNVTPTPVDSNIAKITYDGAVQNIISVEEKMSSFDLVKANKEFSSGYLKIYIDNNIVKVEIQKAGIPTAGDDTPEVIPYEINNIPSPIGVQGHMSASEGNRVNIYTLDEYGRMYLSTLYADPHYYSEVNTYLLDIGKVTAFASLTIPLDDAKEVPFNFGVFKSEDGHYYTDYNFGVEGDIKIVRLDNANPI